MGKRASIVGAGHIEGGGAHPLTAEEREQWGDEWWVKTKATWHDAQRLREALETAERRLEGITEEVATMKASAAGSMTKDPRAAAPVLFFADRLTKILEV